jgi:hypothetical protein
LTPKVTNSLVIANGPGAIGFESVYGGGIIHSTIVNPEGNGDTCNIMKWDWVYWQGMYIVDSICAGFAHSNASIANNTGILFINYNADPAKVGVAPHAYTTSPNENAGGVIPFTFLIPFNPWDNTQLFNPLGQHPII